MVRERLPLVSPEGELETHHFLHDAVFFLFFLWRREGNGPVSPRSARRLSLTPGRNWECLEAPLGCGLFPRLDQRLETAHSFQALIINFG